MVCVWCVYGVCLVSGVNGVERMRIPYPLYTLIHPIYTRTNTLTYPYTPSYILIFTLVYFYRPHSTHHRAWAPCSPIWSWSTCCPSSAPLHLRRPLWKTCRPAWTWGWTPWQRFCPCCWGFLGLQLWSHISRRGLLESVYEGEGMVVYEGDGMVVYGGEGMVVYTVIPVCSVSPVVNNIRLVYLRRYKRRRPWHIVMQQAGIWRTALLCDCLTCPWSTGRRTTRD